MSYGFVLLKNYFDMSGRILTAALLEAGSPFDALSPTLPCPSALLHVEVRRDSFAAGHDTDVGNTSDPRQGVINFGTPCAYTYPTWASLLSVADLMMMPNAMGTAPNDNITHKLHSGYKV